MFGYTTHSYMINALTPPSIPNLAAWFDAADTSTIAHTLGSVSQWNDKSGNGYHVTQAVALVQPGTGAVTLNGLNVLTFDGGDNLAIPSGLFTIPNSDNAVFAVAKITSETGLAQYVLSMTESASVRHYMRFSATAGNILFHNATITTGGISNTGNTNTNHQILTGYKSGTTLSMQVNGDTPATNTGGGNEAGIDAGTIGSLVAGGFLTGEIAEVFIYSRAPSADEIKSLNFYLSLKWGIALP